MFRIYFFYFLLKNQIDTWGDWDNEEYTGSLADTKVFTPSTVQNQSHTEQPLSAPPGLEQQIINKSAQLSDDLIQQYNSTISNATTAAAVVNNNNASNTNQVQYSVQPNTAAQHLRQALDLPQLSSSSSLSAEQSQYFNSLTSQNSTQQPATPSANLVNSYQPVAPVQYASYAEQVAAGQQQVQSVGNNRSKQRARVPPPSKIPSSAVEMPDTLNNIGYLDVQFGGLDFGGDESFDTLSEKFQAANIVDSSQNVSGADVAADYQPKTGVSQTAALASATALQATQLIPNADSLSSQTDNLATSAFNQRPTTVQPSAQNALSTASAGKIDYIYILYAACIHLTYSIFISIVPQPSNS